MGYKSQVSSNERSSVPLLPTAGQYVSSYRQAFNSYGKTTSLPELNAIGCTVGGRSGLGLAAPRRAPVPSRGLNAGPARGTFNVAGRAALGTTMIGQMGPVKHEKVLVLCGPSGAGKSTLIKRLMADVPDTFGFSVSHTSREPRPGERDGIDYHFSDRRTMQRMIDANEFIESADVHGNLYGTSFQSVRDVTRKGLVCILDIDVQGAEAVKRSPVQATYLFVAPPSLPVLEQRLRARGTETEAAIQKRLDGARREMMYQGREGFWDHEIVNENVDRAYAEFKTTAVGMSTGKFATVSDQAAVCRTRYGQVLRKQTILKCDHFPSCWNMALPEHIPGAPNFRQVPGLPIYGVGQPTEQGVANVVERCLPKRGKLLWVNCREEPMIMIHGLPFCVKDREKPFENQDMHAAQIAEMEDKLRGEITMEAMRYDGRILLHGETLPEGGEVAAAGRVYPYWEHVDASRVKTIRDVFARHPKVSFWRWPVTDEHAPQERDFEVLLDILNTEKPAAVVFNCQLGRGRTTTGLVLARLHWQLLQGASVPPSMLTNVSQFRIAEDLVQRLGCGSVKRLVDEAIDECSAMQNLREGIVKTLQKAHAHQPLSPSKSEHERRRASDYLERYVYLILFAAYLDELRSGAHNQAFRAWMSTMQSGRTRVYDLLDEIRL